MEKLFIGNINKSVSIYGKCCYDNAIIVHNKDYNYHYLHCEITERALLSRFCFFKKNCKFYFMIKYPDFKCQKP